jgi:hypothetical protein
MIWILLPCGYFAVGTWLVLLARQRSLFGGESSRDAVLLALMLWAFWPVLLSVGAVGILGDWLTKRPSE